MATEPGGAIQDGSDRPALARQFRQQARLIIQPLGRRPAAQDQ